MHALSDITKANFPSTLCNAGCMKSCLMKADIAGIFDTHKYHFVEPVCRAYRRHEAHRKLVHDDGLQHDAPCDRLARCGSLLIQRLELYKRNAQWSSEVIGREKEAPVERRKAKIVLETQFLSFKICEKIGNSEIIKLQI